MTGAIPLSVKASSEKIVLDSAILRRILHRNSNQHGTTKLFGYLHKLHRRLGAVSGGGEGSDKHDSEIEFQFISVYSEIAFLSLRCFTLVRQYLKERLFLPMYTTLLALSASILHASCVLLVDSHDRHLGKTELPPLPFGVELGHSVVMGRLSLSTDKTNDATDNLDIPVSINNTETQADLAKGQITPFVRERDNEEPVVFDMATLGKRKNGARDECETSNDVSPKAKKKKKKKKKKLGSFASLEESDEIDEIFRGIA